MGNISPLPTADDVLEAARSLETVALKTPLLNSSDFDAQVGGRVFLKAECLQRTGSFKFRGAYNRLSRLNAKEFPGGVVAYSSGNHGQAVAFAARMLGIPATIVMPADAPAIKIAKARRQGARIELYNRRLDDREKISARIANEIGAEIVPPCDNRYIIAGQGTVALEAMAQAGASVDALFVPCGGGGLTAGICLGVEAAGRRTEIWPVEPANFDDTRRSLAAGQRVSNDALDGSICDSLLSPSPHPLSFSISESRVAGAYAATDDEVLYAMKVALEEFCIVLEPGGAVALAAALAEPQRLRNRTTIIVASGGNVDPAIFRRALKADQEFAVPA